jgi:hypothetical protein
MDLKAKAGVERGGRLNIKITEEDEREELGVLVLMRCLLKEIDRRMNNYHVPITHAFSGNTS